MAVEEYISLEGSTHMDLGGNLIKFINSRMALRHNGHLTTRRHSTTHSRAARSPMIGAAMPPAWMEAPPDALCHQHKTSLLAIYPIIVATHPIDSMIASIVLHLSQVGCSARVGDRQGGSITGMPIPGSVLVHVHLHILSNEDQVRIFHVTIFVRFSRFSSTMFILIVAHWAWAKHVVGWLKIWPCIFDTKIIDFTHFCVPGAWWWRGWASIRAWSSIRMNMVSGYRSDSWAGLIHNAFYYKYRQNHISNNAMAKFLLPSYSCCITKQ